MGTGGNLKRANRDLNHIRILVDAASKLLGNTGGGHEADKHTRVREGELSGCFCAWVTTQNVLVGSAALDIE